MSKMICLASVPVKSTRRTTRQPAPFGQGILAYRPHTSTPFTARDAEEVVTMFAEATRAPMTFDALMAQIRGDLVRCEALGRRQDALAASIQMSKMGIHPVCGSSPENDARAEFNRRLEEVMEGIDD
jgi:hypothetical protein